MYALSREGGWLRDADEDKAVKGSMSLYAGPPSAKADLGNHQKRRPTCRLIFYHMYLCTCEREAEKGDFGSRFRGIGSPPSAECFLQKVNLRLPQSKFLTTSPLSRTSASARAPPWKALTPIPPPPKITLPSSKNTLTRPNSHPQKNRVRRLPKCLLHRRRRHGNDRLHPHDRHLPSARQPGLRAAWPDADLDRIPPWSTLDQLPNLKAVLRESLCLSISVMARPYGAETGRSQRSACRSATSTTTLPSSPNRGTSSLSGGWGARSRRSLRSGLLRSRGARRGVWDQVSAAGFPYLVQILFRRLLGLAASAATIATSLQYNLLPSWHR